MLAAILAGLEQHERDPTLSGGVPLRLEASLLEGWSIIAGKRNHYHTKGLPLLLLDATGDPDLSTRLLDRPVGSYRVRVPLDRHQVVQIADAKYAKSTLLTPEGKLNRRTWRRVLVFLRRRCPEARTEGLRPGRTLIVTYKEVGLKLLNKKVLDSLGGEDRVTVTWFWGNRGKDYSDHDQVIILGYPFPNEETVVDFASVIYRGDNLDTTTTTVWRPYLWGDGKTGLEVRVFRDPRMQRICEQLREAEFYQSIMRVRPLGHPWKRVVLLTQVPAIPEQDIQLSGLVDTQELFEAAQRGEKNRSQVEGIVERVVKKTGWIGLPWVADLCRRGFSPHPLLDPSYRGIGENLPPTTALLPKWPRFIELARSHGLGIDFDIEGGKRVDRLRVFFEDALPEGLSACELGLRPIPHDTKGGRPWSAIIYTDGERGRRDLLTRLVRLVGSGRWRVLVDGEEQTEDSLHAHLERLRRPEVVPSGNGPSVGEPLLPDVEERCVL